MANRPSAIAEYLELMLKWYQLVNKHMQERSNYRLVDILYDSEGDASLKVQIVGRTTVFECRASEIAVNDNFLEGFSKKDIRTITYLATREISRPKISILAQEIKQIVNQVVFKLSRKGSKETISKTAIELSQDKGLLNQLSPEDAHLVGYVSAGEKIKLEKQEMERLKQENVRQTNPWHEE